MLSSRQNPNKSPRAMAPEPMGFLSKMRKTLAGKPFHSQPANYQRSRAKSMSCLPQLDDAGDDDVSAAVPPRYVRKASFTANTYPGSCCSVASAGPPAAPEDQRGQAGLANGSALANGRLPNGAHSCANGGSAKPQEAPESLDVSKVFEQQGARPKIPQSAREENQEKEEEAMGHALIARSSPSYSCSEDVSTKPNPERVQSETPAERAPFHSDVAQPCLPPPEANCLPCALSPAVAPVEEGTGVPEFGLVQALGSVRLAQSPQPARNTPKPSSPMAKPHQLRKESPANSQAAYTPWQSSKTPKGALEECNPSRQKASCPLYTSCSPLQDENLERDKVAAPGTVSTSGSEASAADQNFYSPVDASESDSVDACQNAASGNGCKTHSAAVPAADQCGENGELEGGKNSLDPRLVDGMTEIASVDPPREAPAAGAATQVDEATTCSPEWSSREASRHCCTCTCGGARSRPPMGACAPSKSSLTLEDIPPEGGASSEGSPRPPRTPHIAMLVNGDGLFADGEAKSRSLSEHDLHRMLQFREACRLDDSSPSSEGRRESGGSKALEIEAAEALGAQNTAPASAYLPGEVGDSHGLVRGASGGGDSSAPVVDRSSKPRDLCEAVGTQAAEGAAAEAPPPLPPRVPFRSALPVPRPDPFAAYPVLDNEDDDEDEFPTHEFLHDVNIDLYADPSDAVKSKSLPRSGVPSNLPPASPPDLRLRAAAGKRGKTVNMRNRFSQIFRPAGRKKRHSSHGFPDRPLPDIPPNPRLASVGDHSRQNDQPLFGTASGDIVSQQAIKEGLLKENPSKADVEKAREQFAVSLRKISEYGWYWGPMSWDDAESRLENMPDGSFLVRDSSDDRHLLSLSFRAQGSTHHTRVEHHNGKFSFWSQPCSHGSASIVEFVEEAMRHSHSGRVLYFLRPRMPGFPPAAVQLLYPISRFQKARSLQHMCRFVIRKHVRLDHIDALPLPGRLRKYLKEAQYYTPEDILH